MASSKLVIITVFIIDVIAFGLAVAAEQRRSTATTTKDSEQNYNYCVYDSDIATGYGVGAFLFLMVSQVIIMVASSCFCYGKALNPGGSRACALILFVFCWYIGYILYCGVVLVAGSVRNAYHTKYRTIFSEDPPSCQTVRKGVFAAGAAFTFFTFILSQYYYISYSKSRESSAPYSGEAGVGLATYK